MCTRFNPQREGYKPSKSIYLVNDNKVFQSPKGRLQTRTKRRQLLLRQDSFNPQREGYKPTDKASEKIRDIGFNPQREGYKPFVI